MDSGESGIAVIGLAGRFPGANNVDQFWQNLLDAKDSITRFTDDEVAPFVPNFEQLKNNPDYIKARGILEKIEWFDAAFFGISPNEAKNTDPQHRIWLEVAWEALENAGCDPDRFKGAIGVFAGTLQNSYLQNFILKNDESRAKYNSTYSMEAFQLMINNDPGFLPTKTAYKFNLRGPAINVQTACSTSLVAIAQACQSLFNYESDLCLAGGVSISLPQESGYLYQKGAITSADGFCRPFDKNSNGTVASNGVGAVVLKRLEDALADRDHIYAVIKGWATNNDGGRKVSYMAPSVDGQSEVIQMAQAIAEIHPEEISYVEAHGTATPLGDPIEIAGLTKAFGTQTSKKQFCAIGSVKSNIGHVDVAAGVAGFIKSSLIASHKIIPASIHFNEPNPNIDFSQTPFYVQKETTAWDQNRTFNIAVSSFGIGGTNVHVVVQEPPKSEKRNYKTERPHLIVLSAKSDYSLQTKKTELIEFVQNNSGINIHELASTLQIGRKVMPYKSFAVANEAGVLCEEKAVQHYTDGNGASQNKPVVFLFPGQGAQFVNMGRYLYEKEPLCRPIFEKCFSVYKDETGTDLKEILFAEIGEDQEKKLANTEFTQPVLFIVEYAIAKFLTNFGVKPEILIGHSIGEYAAACLAGVFTLEEAMKAVVKRGLLMQKMPGGAMLAVKTGAENLVPFEEIEFEPAALNAPDLTVISVKSENLEKVEEWLGQQGFEFLRLNTSHAFHSSAFDPILNEFASYLSQFSLRAPEIPFISCLTGERITAQMATDPQYWARQLRNPVQFSKGISEIVSSGEFVFIEAGPNTHLTSLVRKNSENTRKSVIIPTLGKPSGQDDQTKLVSSLGKLWLSGVSIDFEKFYSEQPEKIVLPTYPFERKKYWIDWTMPLAFNGFAEKQVAEETSEEKSNKLETQEDSTLTILKKLLVGLTGFEPEMIIPSESFSNLGVESLILTQYAQKIEKKFGIKIEFRQLIHDQNSLLTLSEFVDQNVVAPDKVHENVPKTAQHEYRNFVPFKPEGNKTPLVFLHGDNCDHFLPNRIGEDRPYLGFLHLGSDGEKYGFKDVGELADFYLSQLIHYHPEGPFILGGHSFGGIIAYEMAIKLQQLGYEIPLLILSDSVLFRRIPVFAPKRGIKARIENCLKRCRCNITHWLGKSLPVSLRNFYIIDNYEKLASNYHPPKYSGRVLLLKASINEFMGEILNWADFAENIRIDELQGGHNEIINHPETINEYVRILNEELNKIR
jgi:acyl transferase domain-containing protein/thioesterase domain-containing protein